MNRRQAQLDKLWAKIDANPSRAMREEREMTHTPGPWMDTKLPAKYDRCIVSDGPELIAMVSIGNPHWGANARLIAAAPALLEALEATQALLIEMTGAGNPAAANAIALAKGEEVTT